MWLLLHLWVSCVLFFTRTKVEVVAMRPLQRQPGFRVLQGCLMELQGGIGTSSFWFEGDGRPLIIKWFGDLALEHFWKQLEIQLLWAGICHMELLGVLPPTSLLWHNLGANASTIWVLVVLEELKDLALHQYLWGGFGKLRNSSLLLGWGVGSRCQSREQNSWAEEWGLILLRMPALK